MRTDFSVYTDIELMKHLHIQAHRWHISSMCFFFKSVHCKKAHFQNCTN